MTPHAYEGCSGLTNWPVRYHVRSKFQHFPKVDSLPGTSCCRILRGYFSFPWYWLRNGRSPSPLPSVSHGSHRGGKLYRTDKIYDPPDGQFPLPVSLNELQLALRCNPALYPFLPDDNDSTNTTSSVILVDALVKTTDINGAQPLGTISLFRDTDLLVKVFLDGENLTSGKVPLNGSAALPFNLSSLSPRIQPYDLTCTATLSSSQRIFDSIPSKLTYLPFPDASIGSYTKLDLRTGGLLAKRANDSRLYEPIFPMGFFTNIDGYLDGNRSALEDLKDQGYDSKDVSYWLVDDHIINSDLILSVRSSYYCSRHK